MRRQPKHYKQLSSSESLQLAEQDLANGNCKEALQRALNCFKSVPGPEQRSVLERAYVGRIRELAADGCADRALERFFELMHLEPQVPVVVAELPALRIRLGIGTEADRAVVQQAEPELASAMAVEGADRAVLRSSAANSAFQADVDKVRSALAAIEQGDDNGAEELLKDLARSSPLADWKLFARGLSAFYSHDLERAQANWSRLAPERPALRIAQTLLAANGHPPIGTASLDVSASVRRLKNAESKGGVGDDLGRLAAAWKANRWREFLFVLRDLRQRGGPERMALLCEVGDLAWRRFAGEGLRHELQQLTSIVPAPALDPQWNRARAIAAERAKSFEFADVQRLWQQYLQDVVHSSAIKESERPLVSALVYRHWADFLADRGNSAYRDPGISDRDKARWRSLADQSYQTSVKHDPKLRRTYLNWIKLHLREESFQAAAQVYELFAQAFPDEWEARDWLVSYYLDDNLLSEAQPHLEHLKRLRPREPEVLLHQWNFQVGRIRELTKRRAIREARAATQELESLLEPGMRPIYLDLIRASIEYRAKEIAAAESHVANAVARVPEPTLVWMILRGNIDKYGFDKSYKKDFDARLNECLDRPPTSDTAGRLAQYLTEQSGVSKRYVGQATHVRLVTKYLKRCRQIAWVDRDLRSVCQFLMGADGKSDQFVDKLLKVGKKSFPANPYFPAMIGLMEMDYGPFGCDRDIARRMLELAVELNRAAKVPLADSELQLVYRALEDLDHAPAPFFEFDEFEDQDDEFDEEDLEKGSEPDSHDLDELFRKAHSKSASGEEAKDLKLQVAAQVMLKMLPPAMRKKMEREAAERGVTLLDVTIEFLRQTSC